MQIPTLSDVIFIDIPNSDTQICYDEGYSFGLSFFETILVTHHGVLLDKHVYRINQSLEEFNISTRISLKLLESIIDHYDLKNTALKVQVSEKNVLASTRPLTYSTDFYQRGVHLSYSETIRSSMSPLIRHKSANYGDLILHLRQVRKNGFDDLLLINEHGKITETCIANLFIIKDGHIITPPIKDGLLPGIVRNYLLEHHPITEASITFDDLKHCEGAFLTNSLLGIVHIHKINNEELPQSSLIKTIADDYFYAINKEL